MSNMVTAVRLGKGLLSLSPLSPHLQLGTSLRPVHHAVQPFLLQVIARAREAGAWVAMTTLPSACY